MNSRLLLLHILPLLRSMPFRRLLPLIDALVHSPFLKYEPTLKKGVTGYWAEDLSNIPCCKGKKLSTSME